MERQFPGFGVQYGGECYGSHDMLESYDKFGVADNCQDGTGGANANDVYLISKSRVLSGGLGWVGVT